MVNFKIDHYRSWGCNSSSNNVTSAFVSQISRISTITSDRTERA